MAINADFEVKSNRLVVTLRQSIELYHTQELKTLLEAVFRKESPWAILFDMTEVPYIDSSGLGIFLQLQSQFRLQKPFEFCGLNANVRLVFEYARLTNHFLLVDKPDEL